MPYVLDYLWMEFFENQLGILPLFPCHHLPQCLNSTEVDTAIMSLCVFLKNIEILLSSLKHFLCQFIAKSKWTNL